MGLFGSNDDSQDEANKLANEQIQQNQAELEAKRANLYSAKLDIIRGQGGENWTPDRSSGVSQTPNIPLTGNKFIDNTIKASQNLPQGTPAT